MCPLFCVCVFVLSVLHLFSVMLRLVSFTTKTTLLVLSGIVELDSDTLRKVDDSDAHCPCYIRSRCCSLMIFCLVVIGVNAMRTSDSDIFRSVAISHLSCSVDIGIRTDYNNRKQFLCANYQKYGYMVPRALLSKLC